MENAMSDLLRRAQLPDLSYYQPNNYEAGEISSTADRKRKASTISTDEPKSTTISENDSKRVDSPNVLTPKAPGGITSAGPAATVKPSRASGYGPSRGPSSYTSLEKEEDNEGSSLVTAPMGSLYEVTQLGDIGSSGRSGRLSASARTSLTTDFISRGVVDLQEANELFLHFNRVLNHYLWDGVILVHKDLTSVRMSSSMLSAAILTVTALHMPNKESTFNKCYAEFSDLASGSMLSHDHSFDDLRALCIAAFWLADVSWKLSGYAVRIATELNLHQSYRKAVQGSPEHKEQARLWYILYVCTSTLSHFVRVDRLTLYPDA